MKYIYDILSEKAENQPKALAKELNKLAGKLNTFSFCPTKEKEYARMKPFSTNPELLDIVLEVLSNNKPEDNSSLSFDTVGYWYCVALVSYSGEKKAEAFLSELTDELIAKKSSDISLMRRNMEMISVEIEYADIQTKIDEYFRKLCEESPVYAFANEIGMTLPEGDWNFTFRIGNFDDNKFDSELTQKELEERYVLTVEFFYPKGDGTCCNLNFQNRSNDVHMHNINNFSSDATIYNGSNAVCRIESANDLMRLKETIASIEKAINIQFNKDFDYNYFSKGVKSKKILQDWLKK